MNEAKKNRNAEKYSFRSVEADRFLLMFTNADYDEFKEAVRKGDLNQEDLNTILIFANAGKIAARAALLDPKIPMTSHQIDVFSTLLSTATMAYEYASELMTVKRKLRPLTQARGRERQLLGGIHLFLGAAKIVAIDQTCTSDLRIKLGAALEYSIKNYQELSPFKAENTTRN